MEYANKHFPDRRGWGRSDRKRVYVIYGPPVNIERKEFTDIPVGSFSTIKAIEIWSYIKPETRNSFPSPLDKIYNGEQSFIFADMTGSGVYKNFYSTDANEYFDTRILDRQRL